MAELTSMMQSLCDSSALSASAPPEQWDFKFLSCRPHFLSPRPLSLYSPLCSTGSPLQFNRLDFHLIGASFFIFHSHCNLISFFKVSRIFISSFLFSSSADCQTHLSPLQLWTQFCFPLLFPPGLSCCQLSFSTLSMNLAGLNLLILLQRASEGEPVGLPTFSASWWNSSCPVFL